MRTDFDRAAEIARLAAEFDWTWSRDDLDRFCAAAGWTVTEHREGGASITTDLNIARPGGSANIVANSVQKIDFDVTDRLGTQEAESSGLPGVWFNGLSHRLSTELGLLTRRGEDRMRWDLSTVVVIAYRRKAGQLREHCKPSIPSRRRPNRRVPNRRVHRQLARRGGVARRYRYSHPIRAYVCTAHLAGLQEEFDCSEAVDGIDPFQPQRDATMRTDFDCSAEIFFLATKFD